MKSTQERIKQLVDRIENIPTLPEVSARILAVTQDPSTSAEDVNRIILTDQALTAKILKLVNSAFYGFPRRIGTVTEAVVILGFGTIRNLAITASVFHTFGKRGKGKFDRAAFWKHCVGVGVVSRLLARRLGAPNHEDNFIAGLLHDVGKVVLDQYLHDEFVEALARVESEQISLYEAENEVFGITHADIGGWLSEHWNMPDYLVWSIKFHHEPGKAPGDCSVVPIVHVANSVARYKEIGNGGDPLKPPIQTEALQRLNFTKEHMDYVLEAVDKDLEKAAEFVAVL